MTRPLISWGGVLGLILVLHPSQVRADLGQQLAEMRREVDALENELQTLRRGNGEQMAALRAELAELDRQLRVEGVRARTLTAFTQSSETVRAAAQGRIDAELPVLRKVLQELDAHIRTSLPYRLEARLRALDKLGTKLNQKPIDAAGIARTLWRLLEDENKLANEAGLSQQTIVLDGKPHRVEVAHIGMSLLYFETPDHRFGMAVKGSGRWKFVLINAATGVEVVERLFERLREKRRLGLHTVWLEEAPQ